MWVIMNGQQEFIAYRGDESGASGTPLRFHADPKYARQYPTGKGAKSAATFWKNTYGIELQAVQCASAA